MKFNKSAESDFYYVGDDQNNAVGKILTIFFKGCFFQPRDNHTLSTKQMSEIFDFMIHLEKDLGIDTASTFTSNEDR